MLIKILDCYRNKSSLSRKEFLFGYMLILFLSIIIFWLYISFSPVEGNEISYLIGKSILELLVILTFIPIFAARFRDIGWPPYFVLLLIPIWLFTTRNLIIYMKLNSINTFESPYIMYIEVISAVVLLITFACMLFIRGASSKSLKSDAASGTALFKRYKHKE